MEKASLSNNDVFDFAKKATLGIIITNTWTVLLCINVRNVFK